MSLLDDDREFFSRLEVKLRGMRAESRAQVIDANRAWMHRFDLHFWRWNNEREDRDPEVRAARLHRERSTWNRVEQTQ